MRPGIKQVAERAGVSTATVSHVINGTRFVSEEAKAKVNAAMEELSYRPNSVARSLRSQKSMAVGLIVPILPSDTSNFFFLTAAQGIQKVLREHGYQLLLSSNTSGTAEEEQEQIRLFQAQWIDGLLIAPSAGGAGYPQELAGAGFPVVFIDRRPQGFAGDCVLGDSYGGAYEAVSMLLGKGHRRIGFITGGESITTGSERYAGYRQALEDRGVPLDPMLVKSAVSSFESGYSCAEQLLTDKSITALFIANNVQTMGAMKYVQESGLRVPGELAVVGFDDYDWTRITTPPLTVIRQPAYELGCRAAEVLLARIEHPEAEPQEYRLPAELVMRESC
ncbi:MULTISPECIES: LacI family DNA-binding transcriptional regulator [Paenibacillus]|uniref:LacI family DNA-binding transcriptional regulator n=1 Tax=Paenibacillus TaxID=44249 RepID=UPI0022B8C66C|nr:LacI family DNA-binding transcriptional regulator [Paenibacillus caseinilyticus]MCZ8518157.1 LacI family DNA-binding transcriptional regulator [Paenibacillus caseinilyticus]